MTIPVFTTTGRTYSSDFPTRNQYQANQGGSDAFLTKLDTTKNGASSLIYSTYLGGDDYEIGSGIAVDCSGCAYVTGITESSKFPTRNQYQVYQGDEDAFITKLGFLTVETAPLPSEPLPRK